MPKPRAGHPPKLYVSLNDAHSQTIIISDVPMGHPDAEDEAHSIEIKVPRFLNQYFAIRPLCNVLRAAGIEVIEE